jgi:hypothetical protein
MSAEEIQTLKPKPKIKTPPWISALLALISSVALLFLLLSSMESAFSFVENLFEQNPNFLWFLEIPIPMICTMLFYYNAQHSQKRSLNTLVFLSSATGIGIIGMIIYFIISNYTSLLNNARGDFYYIIILTAISICCGFLSLFIVRIIRNKRTLQKGSLTGK